MSMNRTHQYDGREAEDDFGSRKTYEFSGRQGGKTFVQQSVIFDKAKQLACPTCNAPAYRECSGIVVISAHVARAMHAERFALIHVSKVTR
jgi:hypothetical protein